MVVSFDGKRSDFIIDENGNRSQDIYEGRETTRAAGGGGGGGGKK